jgi:hypothetical protein
VDSTFIMATNISFMTDNKTERLNQSIIYALHSFTNITTYEFRVSGSEVHSHDDIAQLHTSTLLIYGYTYIQGLLDGFYY